MWIFSSLCSPPQVVSVILFFEERMQCLVLYNKQLKGYRKKIYSEQCVKWAFKKPRIYWKWKACCWLRMRLLKRRREMGKSAFDLAPVHLHNILSWCKVNGTIIYVFLHLHYFCLQKPYYKGLIHELVCRFSLSFSSYYYYYLCIFR